MTGIVIVGEVMVELAPLGGQQYALGTAGDTYNTACTLRGLGFDVSYLTALGAGQQAGRVRAHAAANGLHLAEPATDRTRGPGLYMINNDTSGERSFEYWRSDSAASALFKQPDSLLSLLKEYEDTPYLYFTGITLAIMNRETRSVFLAFLDSFRTKGGTVIFDPNYRPALWANQTIAMRVVAQFQTQVDIYLPGFDEEETLFGFDSINAAATTLLSGNASEVVLKNGSESCTLIADGNLYEVQIEPAQSVLDTTGAGDTFNGAYIGARLSKLAPVEAISFASAAAIEVLQTKGGLLDTKQLSRLRKRLLRSERSRPQEPID